MSVDTLIYDLKSPDAGRRQIAARELGALKHRGAIPDLVAMAHDPAAAVRREVELSLERMEDIQTLPGSSRSPPTARTTSVRAQWRRW